MDRFFNWFYVFMTRMFGGVWDFIKAFFAGIVNIFNFPVYFQLMLNAKFSPLEWVFAILCMVVVYAFWGLIIFLIVLLIRRRIHLRQERIGNEDLLEELADLHRDVMRLTREKEKILALKVGQTSITREQLEEIFESSKREIDLELEGQNKPSDGKAPDVSGDALPDGRFARLLAVDEKYRFYTAPVYDDSLDLSQVCEDFRNFACSQMHLYYDLRTIRLLFAGLASTKLLILQGISGTGKTSFPYALGKYLTNDATIVPVQPSWRDRSELFGFFNEFTKKFNETEVLKRIYEANYNDDINVIVLDEMNIARVEYYFAEMLSLMEMPNPDEWLLELVPSRWESDPKLLREGKLFVPQNVWYIGTANNDDTTFAISDKVYDRAFTVNLDAKGVPFDAPETASRQISYSHIAELYRKAFAEHPVSEEILAKISQLDLYVIEHFRVAFGNRIMKQLNLFVPAYVACGGEEIDGVDYLLATKVFRKFDSLNLSLIRDELKGLINYLNTLFGTDNMKESIAYLERLQKMY